MNTRTSMIPFPADTAGSILHNIQHNDRFQKRNNQWAYPTPAMYTTQVAGRCERSAPARPLKIMDEGIGWASVGSRYVPDYCSQSNRKVRPVEVSASGRVTEPRVAGPGMWGSVGRQRRGWLAIFCPNSYCGSTIVAAMRLQGADEFMATTRGFFGTQG